MVKKRKLLKWAEQIGICGTDHSLQINRPRAQARPTFLKSEIGYQFMKQDWEGGRAGKKKRPSLGCHLEKEMA